MARIAWQIVVYLLGLLWVLSGGTARAESKIVRRGDLTMEQARIIARARSEVTRGVRYSSTWQLQPDRGACTDLVVRALRAGDIDLQRLVHEDIMALPGAYGITRPDPMIDHRRVSTLLVFFERNGIALSTDPHEVNEFQPGDVVFFGPRRHVGIVSDKIGRRGLPLVFENGGPRAIESDSLDRRPILGHFRGVNRTTWR